MAADYESSKSRLKELLDSDATGDFSLKLNEANTRARLIDTLFFECLGWNRDECDREYPFEGKYFDYLLGKEGKYCVIEAKKEGIYFELPAGFSKKICGIDILIEQPEINKAIRQTIGYCQSRGVPFGVVCNGHQIIAFVASRQDGLPPLRGRALVFVSLQDMYERFRELWDNLSKPAIENYRLLSTLKINPTFPPDKLSQFIPNYPGFKVRNKLQTELKILGDLFIEDITRAPELEEVFLKECYCPSGALSQYSLISRQLLEARYSLFLQKELQTQVLATNNKKGHEEFSADILSASISRRPIILLGEVGAGKTIFIRNFIKREAVDILKNALVLYIDFGREPALPGDLSKFVINSCKKQLYENYKIDIESSNFVRGVYDLELLRFNQSIYHDDKNNIEVYRTKELEFLDKKISNEAEHLKSSLEHICKGQKRQIVVFLDNIDQRPLGFQDEVFLIGQGLAESWPGTVFLSLRPDTFFYSKQKGSLTGYQPRVFTVSPPRVDLVLSKRLKFVKKQLEETGHLNSLPADIAIYSDRLKTYIDIIISSFEENKKLVEFIDNLSGGNIRLVVDFLAAFIGSGHVDTVKIFDMYQQYGKYTIALHEFLRAVIFGDNEYFSPINSPIANIFDISGPDGREHFLLPIILAHIEKLGISSKQQGYVSVHKIYEACQTLGFQPTQVQAALSKAVLKRLLEPSPKFASPTEILNYRITTVGAYMCQKICGMFVYLDAVIVDVPIIDSSVRAKITEVNEIIDRLDRAMIFVDYLDKQWENLSHNDTVFSWATFSGQVKRDIYFIRERLKTSR